MQLSIESRLPLTTGGSIPVLGFGVWQMAQGEETTQAVLWALEAGYRHIDTATLYANEASVGEAVRKSGIAREEIFITTKLWPTDAFDAEVAFKKSLRNLDMDYVDLYLIHWPVPLFGERVWKQLEALQQQKLARAIGVSNYSIAQLQTLLDSASQPVVNQIEFNPFAYDKELLDFCHAHNVVVEAYSPLTRGLYLDDATVLQIATRHGKSPAQVMLRWAVEKGAVVLPKSSNQRRIKENADIFTFSLSNDDTQQLDRLRSH